MLHPFMPFITEEIWLQKKDRKKLIIHQTWPDLEKLSNIDNRPKQEINWLIDLIQEIRSARSEINIPASLKIDLVIINLNTKSKEFFYNNKIFIERLARIKNIDHSSSIQKGSINISIPGIECFIPLDNLVDLNKEKARLEKTFEKLKSEQLMLNGKLKNKIFLEKAPQDVVDKIKKRSLILVDEIDTKLKAIDRLN